MTSDLAYVVVGTGVDPVTFRFSGGGGGRIGRHTPSLGGRRRTRDARGIESASASIALRPRHVAKEAICPPRQQVRRIPARGHDLQTFQRRQWSAPPPGGQRRSEWPPRQLPTSSSRPARCPALSLTVTCAFTARLPPVATRTRALSPERRDNHAQPSLHAAMPIVEVVGPSRIAAAGALSAGVATATVQRAPTPLRAPKPGRGQPRHRTYIASRRGGVYPEGVAVARRRVLRDQLRHRQHLPRRPRRAEAEVFIPR